MTKNGSQTLVHRLLRACLAVFVLGFFAGPVVSTALAFTVPTRTPVPPPSSGGSGGGGGSNNDSASPPTETPTPIPTETAIPITLVATPNGGFITPEPCGRPTFESTLGTTNVRDIPNPEGALLGQLVFLEVRYIIGRAADGEWWLLELADGSTGWVFDEVGTVRGQISGVPLLDGNGNPQESGSWNPTPDPICPPLPPTETPEPTATATPTPTPESRDAEGQSGLVAEGGNPDAGSAESDTAQSDETEEASLTPTATATAESTDVPPTLAPTEPPAATPTRVDDIEIQESNVGGFNWLLFGGLGLLIIGFGVYLFRGNTGSEGSE